MTSFTDIIYANVTAVETFTTWILVDYVNCGMVLAVECKELANCLNKAKAAHLHVMEV